MGQNVFRYFGLDHRVHDVRRSIGFHGRATADQVLVAVDVVDSAHTRPQLGIGRHERLKEIKR